MKKRNFLFSLIFSLSVQLGFAQFFPNGPNVLYTHDKVGIGIAQPGSKLEVYQQTATQVKLSNQHGFYQLGGGLNFRIRDWSQLDRFFIQGNTGNVGIGTVNPHTRLEIFKHGSPQLRLSDNNGAYQLWGGLNFQIRDVNNLDRFFIQGNTGNVGIGTTNPNAKLHVRGGARINNWLRIGGNTDGFAWTLGVNGDVITRKGKVVLAAEAADKVGVGELTPVYKLHAKGNIFADGGWVRVSGNRGLYFENRGGGFHMTDNTWIRTYGNKNFYHNTGVMRTDGTFQVGSSGNRFEVQSNGTVGIGTTDAQAGLHILKASVPPSGLSANQNGLLMGIRATNSYKWIQSYGGLLSLNPRGNNVSIGATSALGYRLYVNGSAAKPGSSFWAVASDKRLKKDVKSFKDGLEVLEQINPVWFRYKDVAGLSSEERYVGVIAQEVKKAAPYMVKTTQMEEENGKKADYLSYDANALLYILVNSVKEQQTQLKEKDERLLAYDERLAQMEKEMAELKGMLKQTLENKTAIVDMPQTQSAELTDAVLKQNHPNPFQAATTIPHFVPENVKEAILKITAANGQVVKTIRIESRGNGETQLQTNALSPGTYFYTLILDGNILETKSMVLSGRK